MSQQPKTRFLKLWLVLVAVVLAVVFSTLTFSTSTAELRGEELTAGITDGLKQAGKELGKGALNNALNKMGLGEYVDADDFFGGSGGTTQVPGCSSKNCLIVPSAGAYHGIAEETSLYQAIKDWTNFFLGFFALIAMIAIIFAGFMYVTARGEQEQVEKAKKTIIYAVIGIIVVLLAYVIVNSLITYGPQGGEPTTGTSSSSQSGRSSSSTGSTTKNANGSATQVKTAQDVGTGSTSGGSATTGTDGGTSGGSTDTGGEGSFTNELGLAITAKYFSGVDTDSPFVETIDEFGQAIAMNELGEIIGVEGFESSLFESPHIIIRDGSGQIIGVDPVSTGSEAEATDSSGVDMTNASRP